MRMPDPENCFECTFEKHWHGPHHLHAAGTPRAYPPCPNSSSSLNFGQTLSVVFPKRHLVNRLIDQLGITGSRVLKNNMSGFILQQIVPILDKLRRALRLRDQNQPPVRPMSDKLHRDLHTALSVIGKFSIPEPSTEVGLRPSESLTVESRALNLF